jgi:hypothetical protein
MTRSVAENASASWLMAAPPAKIRHHLRGDGGREGRDPLCGHAVIAGEHQDVDPVEPRRVAAPLRQPP